MHIGRRTYLTDEIAPHQVQFFPIQNGERIVRGNQFIQKITGSLFIDIDTHQYTTRKNTGNHGFEHITDLREIKITHVSVTDDIHQIGDRLHHFQNIGRSSRKTVQLYGHRFYQHRKIGGEDRTQQSCQFRDMLNLRHLFQQIFLRSFHHRVSPDSLFNDLDDLFRFVIQGPFFLESTFPVYPSEDSPVDAQQLQAMEEDTSLQIIRLAEV